MNDDYVPTWPAAELDTLLALFRRGETFQVISDGIPGRSRSACAAMARRLGLTRPKPEADTRQKKPTFWIEERDSLLRKLWNDGLASADIASRIGQTPNSIKNRAKRLGLPSRGRSPTPSSLTDDDLALAIQLYKAGTSCGDLAKRFNVTRSLISGRLFRAGVMRQSRALTKVARPARQNPFGVTATPAEAEQRRTKYGAEGQKRLEAAMEPANDDAIPLIGRPSGTCAWPVDTPDRPANQLCCGQRVSGGSPYCERHRAMARTGKSQLAEKAVEKFRRAA